MPNFELTIVTPERVIHQGSACALTLPAWEGSMGVLSGHQAALVLLRPGVVVIREDAGERHLSISGGFADIGPKKVTLFAETAEIAEQIDEERAKLAVQRARETIAGIRAKKKGYEEVDIEAAQAALHRALVRIKAASIARRGRRPGPVTHRED